MKECDCSLCEEGRRFSQIIEVLPAQEKEWMDAFYNRYRDLLEEFSMAEAYLESVSNN